MAGSPSLAMISPAVTAISSPCSRQLLSSGERPANKGSFCNSPGFIRATSQTAFTLSSQRSCVCNSAVSVMIAPMPSEVLGDRLPVFLVLLDRKVHKPEHTEDPSCENPGKQWPSHGVLRSFKSDECFVFDLILMSLSRATIIPCGEKTEKSLRNDNFE